MKQRNYANVSTQIEIMKKLSKIVDWVNALFLGHLLTAVHYRFFDPFDWILITVIFVVNLAKLIWILIDDGK